MGNYRDHLFSVRDEAIRLKNQLRGFANKGEYDLAFLRATTYLEKAKKELQKQAEAGDRCLGYSVSFDDSNPLIKKVFPDFEGAEVFLPEMCINEGISFACVFGENYNLITLCFDVVEFKSNHSIFDLFDSIKYNKLSIEAKDYITQEFEYSKRIASSSSNCNDTIIEIYNEINKSDLYDINKELCFDALANSSYRNGIKGIVTICPPEFRDESISLDCKPTFEKYLDVSIGEVCCQRINNLIQIAHNDSKDKIDELKQQPKSRTILSKCSDTRYLKEK